MPDSPTPSPPPHTRAPAPKNARDSHQLGEQRGGGVNMSAISFNHVLIGLGVLFILVVGFDIVVRGAHRVPPPRTWTVPGGDASRGRMAIIAHGCGGCHVIPGIRGASGRVGPQLTGFQQQVFIAGRLENTPDNLIQWIQNPQHIDPLNAMPDLNVSEGEARDIAAYLYTLR